MIDTTRIRILGAAVAAVGAFALTSTALAGSPPKPVDPLIEPGVLLGGVAVGQGAADAEAAWKSAARCKDDGSGRICAYGSIKRGTGEIIALHDKVAIASITAPFKNDEFVFKGPLMRFGTTKGDLGLGDKLSRIAKRYPGAKETGRSLIYSDGDVRMTFFASHAGTGRVTQIILAKAHLDEP